jgi:hypothetical protein
MTERILASIFRNPKHTDTQIAKNIKGTTKAQVGAVRNGSALLITTHSAEVVPAKKEEAPVAGGFKLSNLRVLTRKPAESAAKFIKRLPKGRGYCPRELSKEWGMSEETIKRHARDMNCLKFVEVSEDEWKTLIMSPETSATYNA